MKEKKLSKILGILAEIIKSKGTLQTILQRLLFLFNS
jgi:hypothetical protein